MQPPSDHQCRAAALRAIVTHAALRVIDSAAYNSTMRALMARWAYYDARILKRMRREVEMSRAVVSSVLGCGDW